MNLIRLLFMGFTLVVHQAWSQQEPGNDIGRKSREWTNRDGLKITAESLGIQGSNVVLKLQNGKIARVPVVSLSLDDNSFLRDHGFAYHEPWQAWPPDAGIAMKYANVKEETSGHGSYVYTTPHFRFHCDVNLGMALMNDLARVFELTLRLHEKSPFGILAKPEKDRFEARLFGSQEAYMKAGGPQGTAGVYQIKERIFLAPLELMGVKPGSAGWRKISDDYNNSTIIHELTHMLTHDMLDNLPTWVNEGYAEYISNIPVEGKSFKTANDKIREGMRDTFVRGYEKELSTPSNSVELGRKDRDNYLKSDSLPPMFKVEKVLQMSDVEWATGSPARANSEPFPRRSTFTITDRNRLPRLYRSAHLIIYYFIQIEGEKGVLKIRRFLEENRRNLARYHRYLDDFKIYDDQMRAFMNLPGVTKLPDGRVQYPSNLQPPKAPEPPFTDPNTLKLGGLGALLDGESAEIVGNRIEKALIEHLDMNLKFETNPKTKFDLVSPPNPQNR